jgi:opacity protein-like surface antigen
MKSSVGLVATVVATLLVPQFLGAVEVPAKSIAATTDGVSSSVATDTDKSDPKPAKAKAQGDETPRVELFLGYSYLRATPTYSPGNRLVWLNGGSASMAFNFNRYLGVVADFAGFDDSKIYLYGPGEPTSQTVASGGNAYTYMFGPRLSYRNNSRLTPFAQALFGEVHASQVTLNGCAGTGCIPLPSQNAFAMTAGGGLDLKLQRHLSLRLVQAEYLMTRFSDPTTDSKSMQNDIRLSSGLLLSMGGGPAPLPVTYSCVANPASVYPGDPVTITGTALNLNPKRKPVYSWQSNAGKVSGTSDTATIDTTAANPGTYTAQGHVSEGTKVGHFADCSTSFTVMAFQPPTVSCSANPSTVLSGQPATITAQGISPQNRPLTYSYAASAGAITGTSSTATLDTTASAVGSINVTCNVTDDKGQTASATTTVVVQTPVAAPAPTIQNLCSINFDRDARRPTRVDNEAKACLDDIALNLQRSSNANVAIVGNGTPKEAAQRAVNTREYLVVDKGIDASRIAVYTKSSDSKSVDTILIPAGAALSPADLTPVDESVKPISRTAVPRHHVKK